MTHRSNKEILTNEDWCPTKDGKVDVSLVGWSDGKWKVSVWGNDDYGLERHFDDRASAQREFDRTVNLTTKAELKARGFVNA